MSAINKIGLDEVRKIGFNTRVEFNKFIKDKQIKILKNETEKQFLNRVKKMRIVKKKKNVIKNKIIKRADKDLLKEIKNIEPETLVEKIQKTYIQNLKERLTKLENDEVEEVYIPISKKGITNNINNILYTDLGIEHDDIINLILRERYNKNTVLSIDGNNYITLTERNREKIKKMFKVRVEHEEEDSFNSWLVAYNTTPDFLIVKKPYSVIKQEITGDDFNDEITIEYKKKKGAFFKYLNKLDIDLEKYGIFKIINTGEYDATQPFFKQSNNYYNCDYRDNCLYNAFKYGAMDENKLNNIKLYFKNRHISVDNLKLLCKEEQINIIITFIKYNKGKTEGYTDKIEYGSEYDETYEIGLLDNHYFINDMTEYTKYSIENYFNIKDKKDFNYIYNNRGDKDKKRCINSFNLIKLLLENKETHLKEMTIDEDILFSNFYDKFIDDDIKSLEYNENSMRENNLIEPKINEENEEEDEKDKFELVFFDCETNPNELHKVYLICSINERDEVKSFYNGNLVYNFLCSLKTNTILIAHNAGYDFRFIYDFLTIEKFVSKGKKLMFVNAIFKNPSGFTIKIRIRDSLNMINMKLSKFNESFDIDYNKNKDNEDYIIKEVMPYKFYTEDNIKKRFCKIEDALTYINDTKDKEQFIKNIEKWNIKKDDTYDIIKYSEYYCIIDCKILKMGYMKFREMMFSISNLDIINYVSLPSIAQEYLINNKCYEGVYYLQGIPQLFISRCIVGGRTMMKDNEKQKETNTLINDFDGVSLYPSAMNVMKGFLKGLPKIIPDEQYNIILDDIPEFLRDKDGYFIKIKILSVGIKRHFPLGSIIQEDGTRLFTNDLINKIQYVDNYMLEDLLNFQKITYSIEQGYYFNEGLNKTINEVMLYLFNERVKQKKLKNPIQIVLKELMNSSYGKTILKPIENETKIFNNTKTFNSFIKRNYEFVSEITILAGDQNENKCKRLVKVIKNIMVHKNIPQVGVQVLSRSKRIMNEVICLAEDNNLDVYYQDTDSLHIKDENIIILKEKFYKKYGRELEGKNLGQFHSDFEMNGCKNVIATDSLFCAKKMYIDKLRGIDIKTGEIKYSYHRRLKGVSDAGIDFTIKENNLKDEWELYERLYNGEFFNMDLGAGGQKAIFKLNKDFSIETLETFRRIITLEKDKEKRKEFKNSITV